MTETDTEQPHLDQYILAIGAQGPKGGGTCLSLVFLFSSSMAEGTDTIFTLWFAMIGDSVKMDSLEISSNANVVALRLLVKARNEHKFQHTDASDIDLWQVGTSGICCFVAAHLSSG